MNNTANNSAHAEVQGRCGDAGPADIAIDQITVDPALQMRAQGTDAATVADYAEAMADGAVFPAIVVMHDGDTYWLVDGFTRLSAAEKIGLTSILADVRQGSRRDGLKLAVGGNADHGLRRSQADKRRAVETLLRDPDWSRLSDRKIGEAAKVDHKTIAKIRRELTSGEIPTPRPARESAEIPTAQNGRQVTGAAEVPTTMVGRMLATVSTAALVAECVRRGLAVAAP